MGVAVRGLAALCLGQAAEAAVPLSVRAQNPVAPHNLHVRIVEMNVNCKQFDVRQHQRPQKNGGETPWGMC